MTEEEPFDARCSLCNCFYNDGLGCCTLKESAVIECYSKNKKFYTRVLPSGLPDEQRVKVVECAFPDRTSRRRNQI